MTRRLARAVLMHSASSVSFWSRSAEIQHPSDTVRPCRRAISGTLSMPPATV
ncbi:MAG: hypothetical protein WDN03_14760 [Rhizomicrobium sp.]